jgi:hypothetical protein
VTQERQGEKDRIEDENVMMMMMKQEEKWEREKVL